MLANTMKSNVDGPSAAARMCAFGASAAAARPAARTTADDASHIRVSRCRWGGRIMISCVYNRPVKTKISSTMSTNPKPLLG